MGLMRRAPPRPAEASASAAFRGGVPRRQLQNTISEYEAIDPREFEAAADECLRRVSTDFPPIPLDGAAYWEPGDGGGGGSGGGDGDGDGDGGRICTDPEATFAGCASADPTAGTVVRGSLTFYYDLYLTRRADEEEAIRGLESNILRYLGGRTAFACGGGAGGGKRKKKEEPGILGISSDPSDGIDSIYARCSSGLPDVIGDGMRLKCLPMVGRMTYYLSEGTDVVRAASSLLIDIHEGAGRGAYVSARDESILGIDLVDRWGDSGAGNGPGVAGLYSPSASGLAAGSVVSGATAQIAGTGGAGAGRGTIAGAVAGALVGAAILLALLLVWRRETRRSREVDQIELDLAKWRESDGDLPEDYAITRGDVGVSVGIGAQLEPPSRSEVQDDAGAGEGEGVLCGYC